MSCYIPQLSHTHTNLTEKERDSPSRCGLGVGVTAWRLPEHAWPWGQGRLSLHVVLDCHHLLPSVSQAWTLIPRQYLDSDNDLWLTHQSIMKEKTQGELANQSAGDATGWREQNVNSQQGLLGGKRENVSIIDWLACVHHVRGQRRTEKWMRQKNQHCLSLK